VPKHQERPERSHQVDQDAGSSKIANLRLISILKNLKISLSQLTDEEFKSLTKLDQSEFDVDLTNEFQNMGISVQKTEDAVKHTSCAEQS